MELIIHSLHPNPLLSRNLREQHGCIYGVYVIRGSETCDFWILKSRQRSVIWTDHNTQKPNHPSNSSKPSNLTAKIKLFSIQSTQTNQKPPSDKIHIKMSSQTIYIPNLIGGQALQVTQISDCEYSISAPSMSSRGMSFSAPTSQNRPTSSSSGSSFLPDDAFWRNQGLRSSREAIKTFHGI